MTERLVREPGNPFRVLVKQIKRTKARRWQTVYEDGHTDFRAVLGGGTKFRAALLVRPPFFSTIPPVLRLALLGSGLAVHVLGCGSSDSDDQPGGTECDNEEVIVWAGDSYEEARSESEPDECSPNIVYADSAHLLIDGPGHSVVTIGAEWEVNDGEQEALFSLTIGDPDEDGPDIVPGSYSLVTPGGGEGAEASVLVGRLTPEMGSCLSTGGVITLESFGEPGDFVEGSYEVTGWGGANCPTPPSSGTFRVRHAYP